MLSTCWVLLIRWRKLVRCIWGEPQNASLELAALFSARRLSRRMFEAMAGALALEALEHQAAERRQRTERKARQ
jgi:hypothetical protein